MAGLLVVDIFDPVWVALEISLVGGAGRKTVALGTAL
jgi:hypothetical protein